MTSPNSHHFPETQASHRTIGWGCSIWIWERWKHQVNNKVEGVIMHYLKLAKLRE